MINNITQLIQSLYQIGAIEFGEFILKSGQTSSIYVNLRKIISYPNLLKTIAHTMMQKLEGVSFDLICGVPYTALPIATCLSLDFNIPMVMRRKEKKDYGTKQSVEGVFNSGQTCLIIEDIITTGSSILETAAELNQAGLIINDVIALIDREQGGAHRLAKHYRVHTIFSLTDILKLLLAQKDLPTHEHDIIRKLLSKE